jgi:ribosomal-protein-serine acetyltransferase
MVPVTLIFAKAFHQNYEIAERMINKPVLCIQVNEEIQLCLLEERHSEEYFTLIQRNKAYLNAWIDVEAYEGSQETLKIYVKQRLFQYANDEGYHLGIWYQDTLIGIIDYRPNQKNLTVELGYWLDEEHQGKGIVTQACRTMIQHAFEERHMLKIVISCAIDNLRSRAVAERLGFLQEGILRQVVRLHDRSVDCVFYGLLIDEWRAQAALSQ